MKLTDNGREYADILIGALGPNPHTSGFLGLLFLGIDRLGLRVPLDDRFGIYQTRKGRTGRIQVRMDFYRPSNPRTTPQQSQRSKMVDGMVAWHALTDMQREEYNERAKGTSLTGHNLFLREYLLSH